MCSQHTGHLCLTIIFAVWFYVQAFTCTCRCVKQRHGVSAHLCLPILEGYWLSPRIHTHTMSVPSIRACWVTSNLLVVRSCSVSSPATAAPKMHTSGLVYIHWHEVNNSLSHRRLPLDVRFDSARLSKVPILGTRRMKPRLCIVPCATVQHELHVA